MELCAFADDIAAFREWISGQPRGALRLETWNRRLRADHEAALGEVMTWQFLRAQGLRVEHAEDLSHGGPDFRCFRKHHQFYAETTTLQIDTVTKHSRISDEPGEGPFSSFSLLTNVILNKCKHKARQLAGLNAPALLVIGTFHGFAAMVCLNKRGAASLLTDEPKMCWTVDTRTGRISPAVNVTDLSNAAFVGPNDTGSYIAQRRTSISGVLLCSFGMPSREVYCALHPAPHRPFHPTWLPNVEFCRLTPGWETGSLRVEWIDG